MTNTQLQLRKNTYSILVLTDSGHDYVLLPKAWEVYGYPLIVHHDSRGKEYGWKVSEVKTGLAVESGPTRTQAIDKGITAFNRNVLQHTWHSTVTCALQRWGYAPTKK